MAYFSGGSQAVVNILSKLRSAEKPVLPVDHSFCELGSIRYHIQASVSDQENIFFSISTPVLSQEEPNPNGLDHCILQDIRTNYSNFADIIEPPKEGYTLTLKLNFSRLTRTKEYTKAINMVSSLQVMILNSQLKDTLKNLWMGDIIQGSTVPLKLVNYKQEPFFIFRAPKKVTVIFPMRFKDDSDVTIATSFIQELADLGSKFPKAPRCEWSPIPPQELRGEPFEHLSTNGDILRRHVKGKKADKTAWILLNFQQYVRYHVKCTRGSIQRRMRHRLEVLSEAIERARIGGETKSREEGRKQNKKWLRFSKSKKFKRGINAITDKIRRLRLRIKIQGLGRFHRHCFHVPKFPALGWHAKRD
ncbi:actin-related protein 2/3 complex subunit 2B-like isoform X2 [Carex rostrata]